MDAAQFDPSQDYEVFEHVTRFSRCFYEAFRVVRNRVRFWRFLFLVLEKTEKPGATIRNDFSQIEISRVLGRPEEDTRYWRKQLIKQFQDPGGKYLKKVDTVPAEPSSETAHRPVGRPAQVNVFELSGYFEAAAKKYVRGVITLAFKLPIAPEKLDRFLGENGTELFRKIMKILGEHYYGAWLAALRELVTALNANEGVKTEIGEHAPYWVITVVAWKEFCLNPKAPFELDDFYTEVRQALRRVDRDEVERCLHYMSQKGFFTTEGEGVHTRYILSPKCEPILQKYTIALKAARKRLRELLVAEIT